jgi:TolB-like protein
VLRTPARGIRIAVARFENQSRDPSLDNFTDGLSDTFVAELTTASGGGFHVIGNAAVLRGARDRQDLRRIANDLQADFVVLGQVQRAADRGRVLIHLIRLPDQSHLWVTRVDDPDFGDPLTAERQIASRAVREFISKLPSPPPNTSR